MFNLSIKGRLYGLLLLVTAILLTSSMLAYRSLTPIESEWNIYLEQVAKRQALLMEIKSQFGYGGSIHHFKNHASIPETTLQSKVLPHSPFIGCHYRCCRSHYCYFIYSSWNI